MGLDYQILLKSPPPLNLTGWIFPCALPPRTPSAPSSVEVTQSPSHWVNSQVHSNPYRQLLLFIEWETFVLITACTHASLSYVTSAKSTGCEVAQAGEWPCGRLIKIDIYQLIHSETLLSKNSPTRSAPGISAHISSRGSISGKRRTRTCCGRPKFCPS